MYPVAILGQKLGQPGLALVPADHPQMQRSHRHSSFSCGILCPTGRKGAYVIFDFRFSGFSEFMRFTFSDISEKHNVAGGVKSRIFLVVAYFPAFSFKLALLLHYKKGKWTTPP